MRRAKPITEGTWVRCAPKTYRHETGIMVRYDHNRWLWEVIGPTPDDGHLYTTLTVAQYSATRHLGAAQ